MKKKKKESFELHKKSRLTSLTIHAEKKSFNRKSNFQLDKFWNLKLHHMHWGEQHGAVNLTLLSVTLTLRARSYFSFSWFNQD